MPQGYLRSLPRMEAKKVDSLSCKYNIYPCDVARCRHLLHKAIVIRPPSLKCCFFICEIFHLLPFPLSLVSFYLFEYTITVRSSWWCQLYNLPLAVFGFRFGVFGFWLPPQNNPRAYSIIEIWLASHKGHCHASLPRLKLVPPSCPASCPAKATRYTRKLGGYDVSFLVVQEPILNWKGSKWE